MGAVKLTLKSCISISYTFFECHLVIPYNRSLNKKTEPQDSGRILRQFLNTEKLLSFGISSEGEKWLGHRELVLFSRDAILFYCSCFTGQSAQVCSPVGSFNFTERHVVIRLLSE